MIDTLNQIIEYGIERNLLQNFTSTAHNVPNSSVVIEGHEMLNFGSCSYLGLEKHNVLKEGTIDAVTKYGTQFSSSRTYLSHGLYYELEDTLRDIFQRPLIVTASTTLGHLATIPIVVGKNDAVVLDLQVHSSIQMTIQQLKAKGIPTYIIRHNCMESLEMKIKHLYNKYDKIWYFADGVYSMYGDYAPFEQLDALMAKYEKFHLYIDDAHGMGWTGENGCGVVHSRMNNTEKMILAVSLNKSFGAAGGCLIFPNAEMERKVRNCGSTYIFSGPVQPPMLGAAIASAQLHLSEEIKPLQDNLLELINYTNDKLDELGFPQFQKTDSPLFFIPVGAFKMSADVVFKMRAKGFFLNTASFPAVPMRKSGIRFMVNNFLKKEHIDEMLTTLCNVYSETIIENDTNYKKIAKTFNIPEFDLNIPSQLQHDLTKSPLSINIHRSIKELNAQEWNNTFFKNGTLTHSNLALIEDIYSKDSVLENQWDFYYLVIKDHEGKTVLQSPITVALTKDDMLHPGSVSQKIETVRAEKSPYYLTSKTVLTGTLITKGNHVYIDYTNPNWKCALSVLIDTLNTILDETGASKIMIRDFYGKQDLDFETAMLEKGFIKFQLLNNMEINKLDWNNRDEYLKSLSQKYRYNVRKEIIKYESHFVTTTQKITSEEELLKAYQLYEQVYDKSYDLNVFKLPLDFFRNICASDEYDVIRLYINNTDANGENILVGVMFSHVHEDIYNAMIVGLNYEYVYNYNCYKQILYKTLLRAKELDCNKLDLAFTAELEKKKLGAKPTEVFAYVQSTEHLKGSILAFT